jgi:probable HAF family extracellular repeat protein
MRRTSYGTIVALLVACNTDPPLTQPFDPAREAIEPLAAPLFEVHKIASSLGGTLSIGRSITNGGSIAGFSLLPGNQIRHAVVWRGGVITDLGTLGGGGGGGGPLVNSSVVWPGENENGMIVGISQTATRDTLGETWSCSAFMTFTGFTCVGFVWENGVMKALPTLGGDNGFAAGVNNRAQVVGWAETRVVDPTCRAPQKLQFRAVLWEPKKGRMRELPPLPGDSTSAATAINERGDVVGISGRCDVAVGRFSAQRSVLWTDGQPGEIANLGGETWHTPMALNERGDVVGFSNPPGDVNGSFLVHAFLWTRDAGIKDLGTLPGDSTSQALGINERRQVVGVSTSRAGRNRAFFWEDGVMYDLTDIVDAGFGDSLVTAQHINDAGRITGRLFEKSTGQTLPFIAVRKR